MELPSVSGNIFSPNPGRERRYRWLCLYFIVALVIILYLFWLPLRDTGLTYSLVSIAVHNTFVLLFFQGVTVLGSEGFFLVFLSVIYWSFNKSLGFWGLLLMPSAIFITSEIPKDIVRLPRPDVRGVTVPTYTFPSGHASGAVSVWGYLAIMIKKRRFWIWSIIIIALVGLSRVMLGYHFPGDVIGGLVTGMIFLALFLRIGIGVIENRTYEKLSFSLLLSLALFVPLGLSFIPAEYAPNLMGYLAGAAAGRLLETKKLNFDPGGDRRQHLFRALIGISVIAALIPGIGMVVPHDINMLTFIQHALSTFWVTFLAPLFFIKVGLARPINKS